MKNGSASIQAQIRQSLAALEPVRIDLVDDSAQHAGHVGAASGGGHYQLRIISPHFAGQTRIMRHRAVYNALSALMQREIHALNIIALTPDEAG